MRGITRRAVLASLAVIALVACGSNAGDEDETAAMLVLEPATSELLILNGTPATQQYTAKLVFPDGHSRDVTDETIFSVDAAFGTFSGPTASIITAGKMQVFGQRDDKVGSAQIIARVKSTRVDPSLPPNTPDLFGGAEDPSRAPTVVYPPVDVVMPRNLGDFEIHWIDASLNDIFEISLQTEFADIRVYLRGGNGDGAAGPMPSFSSFLASEWLSAVGIEPTVAYRVRGVQESNPGPVGAGPARLVKLSNETLEGGLYYWAATAAGGGAYGIFRHDMSKPGQPAEEFMTTTQTAGRCVACHALSRDGKKMAITYDGGDGAATLIDVATSTRMPDLQPWNFATFTPDASKVLTVSRGIVTVRNAADGVPLTTMPAATAVSHPEVSPDGTRLVYVARTEASGTGVADWDFGGGRIFTRTFDPVTLAFGPETPLVQTGVNNFYPSWSPDGQWILFNRADSGGAYNNGQAMLFVIKSDGSAPEVPLTAANQALSLTNSWGRWAPFAQTVGANGEPIFWVTVSSKRDFGVRLVGAQRPQIWMTPFFVNQAGAAADPSAAAFRLPFQNITSNNHIAQWTERVVTTL